MNTHGARLLNQLAYQGRNIYLPITGRELKERVHSFIYNQTKISLPFYVDTDIDTGAFFMEIDFEELSDDEYALLSKTFANPQEFYLFTNEVVRQMFNEDTYIYLSEEAEEELYEETEAAGMYYFTICTPMPMDCFKVKDDSFAHVSWSEEDVRTSLNELGVEHIADELVRKIMDYPRLEKTMQEMMISCGWDVLKDIVSDILANE